MINLKVQDKLNTQIQKEFTASATYLAMAVWCLQNNYAGAADFLFNSADDERNHGLEIVKYLAENNASVKIPAIKSPSHEFTDLVGVFNKVMALEQEVTQSINDLADFSLSQKDFASFQFLQAFVTEQQSSERTVQYILDVLAAFGKDKHNLFLADTEIKKLNTKPSVEQKP